VIVQAGSVQLMRLTGTLRNVQHCARFAPQGDTGGARNDETAFSAWHFSPAAHPGPHIRCAGCVVVGPRGGPTMARRLQLGSGPSVDLVDGEFGARVFDAAAVSNVRFDFTKTVVQPDPAPR